MKIPEIGSKMEDGTVYAGVSPNTGRPMYVMPEDALMIGATFNDAARFAAERSKGGHKDWRLPTLDELSMLFYLQDKGALKGTFNKSSWENAFYWSSTPGPDSSRMAQNFLASDGCVYGLRKNSRVSVRYIRS